MKIFSISYRQTQEKQIPRTAEACKENYIIYVDITSIPRILINEL